MGCTYVSNELNSSQAPPKPWKIHNHENAFQPSMAQSTTMKVKFSGVLASCIPPIYWCKDTWMWNQMCIMQCRMKLYGRSHVACWMTLLSWECSSRQVTKLNNIGQQHNASLHWLIGLLQGTFCLVCMFDTCIWFNLAIRIQQEVWLDYMVNYCCEWL